MARDTAGRIRHTAVRLFKEAGFANVTVDDICRAVKITKSTFYYHYKSKVELLGRFYDTAGDPSPQSLRIIAGSDNHWERYWAYMEPGLDWNMGSGPQILSQILITSLQNRISAYTGDRDSELDGVFIGIIRKGQESGQFLVRDDPAQIQRRVKALILGYSAQWCVEEGRFDFKSVLREALRSLLGVRPDLT